jgi:hypothetical protein
MVASASTIHAGDVIDLRIPGQHLLVVSSIKAIRELLNNSIYSDRPIFPMVGVL